MAVSQSTALASKWMRRLWQNKRRVRISIMQALICGIGSIPVCLAAISSRGHLPHARVNHVAALTKTMTNIIYHIKLEQAKRDEKFMKIRYPEPALQQLYILESETLI